MYMQIVTKMLYKTAYLVVLCCSLMHTTMINPRPEGYGSRFVVLSIYLSTALQRAALTSSRQLRYEQAKHVDGLQSDGWILLKCFRSRVMAGSP